MENMKHSAFGIASFIVSLVSGAMTFLLIFVAGLIEISTPGGMSEESAEAMIIGLFMLILLLAFLVSLGLGITGLCENGRRKVFAILGTLFSSVLLFSMSLLLLTGMAMA